MTNSYRAGHLARHRRNSSSSISDFEPDPFSTPKSQQYQVSRRNDQEEERLAGQTLHSTCEPVVKITDSDLEYEPEEDDGLHDLGSNRQSQQKQQQRVHPLYGQRVAFPGLDEDEEAEETLLEYGSDDRGRGLEDNTGYDEGAEPKKKKARLCYEATNTGLEYLKFVRSEAKGVPHLLAQSQCNGTSPQFRYKRGHATSTGEEGGYFQDGAFIAAPVASADNRTHRSNECGISDTQAAYYKAMKSRFHALQYTLRQTPLLSAVEALTSDHPISLPPNSIKAQKHWRHLIQRQPPQTAQVACMDLQTVLELIKLFTTSLASCIQSKSRDKLDILAAWIWSVLGRCHPVNELDSEEVAELRGLGRRASVLLGKMRRPTYSDDTHLDTDSEQRAEAKDNVRDDDIVVDHCPEANKVASRATRSKSAEESRDRFQQGDTQDGGEPSDAKAREGQGSVSDDRNSATDRDKVGDEVADDDQEDNEAASESQEEVDASVEQQTRILLDIIITIVGDCYGQRDLLALRDEWT